MDEKSKIIRTLENLGLSKNQASVYLSMLMLGPSTIIKIAKQSKIRRTTIYPILQDLQKRGLIRIETKGFKTNYAAENPKTLTKILERKQEAIQNMLPQLEAMYNLEGGESFIKYYEGIESVRTIYENLLKDLHPHENYFVIGDPDRWSAINKDFYKQFIKDRIKIPLNAKILLVHSETSKKYKKTEKNFNEEVRLLPPKSEIETNFIITPRKVIIQQMINPIMAIVIENKSVIKLQSEMFKILWNFIGK